jgi:flavorubredoxin
MNDDQNVKALVVYESFFGNTESIARAIASGLRLEGVAATDRDVKDAHDVEVPRPRSDTRAGRHIGVGRRVPTHLTGDTAYGDL